MRTKALAAANAALARGNLRLDFVRPRTWDRFFDKWIAEAQARGVDPNDVGDAEWENDQLSRALDEFYLPRIRPESVVVELGPGSGRLSRHLIGKVKHLVLVDYSPAVTAWLTGYLAGQGSFEVRLIERPGLPWQEQESVDIAFAHGVVEHFDQEVLVAFLGDLQRVLRPGGQFVFTFDDLSSPDARVTLIAAQGEVVPQRFRFYEPAAIDRLGRMFGFDVELTVTGERISFATYRKPERS